MTASYFIAYSNVALTLKIYLFIKSTQMCLKTNVVVVFLTKVTHLKSLKSLTTQGVK